MKKCIATLLQYAVLLLALVGAVHCGGLPAGVRSAIFESANFASPIGIDPGQSDRQELLDLAYSRRIDRGLLPTIWTTSYRNSDKHTLSYLVSKRFARVECVTIQSRYETNDVCFIIHLPSVAQLERAARRELVSIEYTNKYQASPMGVPVTFYAVTFKYRIINLIPEAPVLDGLFDGQAKAWLNPDTGKWKLDSLTLSDRGSDAFAAVIQAKYSPFEASSAERRPSSDSKPLPSSDTVGNPPNVVTSKGACPFEGCQLGKWTARETVTVYDGPEGTPTKMNIRQGQSVVAIAGEIRAIPRKAIVTNIYATDAKEGIRVGDTVYVLYPLGEGAVAVWHNGKVVNGSLNLRVRYEEPLETRPLQWTWWVQIKMPDGTTGWLKGPEGKFDGMDCYA